ncbi:MAG: hypothetical protein F2835_08840, partial [Actinobacteria bacterium]|nr:hypothetical protein [Actinomycetota bacterium]
MSSTTPPGSDSDGAETPAESSGPGALDPLTALLREVEGTSNGASTESNDAMETPTSDLPPPPSEANGKRRKKVRKPKPRWLKITAVVIAVLLVLPLISFTKAMITTQNLSFAERGAEWMRDNHLGGVLNTVESWWLSNNQPKEGGDPNRAIDVPVTGDGG